MDIYIIPLFWLLKSHLKFFSPLENGICEEEILFSLWDLYSCNFSIFSLLGKAKDFWF